MLSRIPWADCFVAAASEDLSLFLTEQLLLVIHGLYNAICIQKQDITGFDGYAPLFVFHIRSHSQGNASDLHRLYAARSSPEEQRRIMAGIGIDPGFAPSCSD